MERKFTLLSVALGFCYFSFGQLNYGLRVGITQSRIKESLSSSYLDMNFKSGIQAGAFLDFSLLKNLNFRPALQLSQKGYKAVDGSPQGPFYRSRNFSFTYLELPIDFVYNIPLSKTAKFYVGTGPVVGLGLFGSGKGIITGTDGSGQLYTQEGTGNHPFSKSGFKRIDLGADFLTGIQLKRFMLTASYNPGLLNVLNYDHGIQSKKHRSFALNVGYCISNH